MFITTGRVYAEAQWVFSSGVVMLGLVTASTGTSRHLKVGLLLLTVVIGLRPAIERVDTSSIPS